MFFKETVIKQVERKLKAVKPSKKALAIMKRELKRSRQVLDTDSSKEHA